VFEFWSHCGRSHLHVRFLPAFRRVQGLRLRVYPSREPGLGIPVWRYFGAELDHLSLLFLFIIFFVADAGKEWGLGGRRPA